jgi:4-nitrophenyl phosphatase
LDLSKTKALILDMDGVLWRGDEAIGNLPEIFHTIQKRGWQVMLATNNATRSATQFLEKLAKFGVVLEEWQVINSPVVTALYLDKLFPGGGPVYILGEEGVHKALEEKGFYHAEDDVLAVVVGLDRQLSYDKLMRATLHIRSGKPFIGTNPDKTYPMPEGLVPGAGAVIAVVETASDVKPTIMGKPMPEMYCACLERMHVNAEETLVVGDRLETDIAAGQTLGCRTALVLSGVTTREMAEDWQPKPDWIGPDLATLVNEYL